MLKQKEVFDLLNKNQSQVVTFNILWAFVYSKASRGNLPSEILAKLISIHRKLIYRKLSEGTFPNEAAFNASPTGLAFEAMRRALLDANRRWTFEGPRAFANLGLIGSTGGSPDAEWAWRKATDGKVKEFPTSSAFELDAGRVNVPFEPPPPMYDAPPAGEPPSSSADATATTARAEGEGNEAAPEEQQPPRTSTDEQIEAGRAHLARLREQRMNAEISSPTMFASPRAV